MRPMGVATIAWRPESPRAILNPRLPPFIPFIGVAGSWLLSLPKSAEKELTTSPALFVGKDAYIRTLLQRLVIHRDRAVNQIVVLR